MSQQPSNTVNPLHPSVIDKLDPQFVEVYNKHQAPYLQANHVPYKVYNADRAAYTIKLTPGPSPSVQSANIYTIPVSNPLGEIKVQVFQPSEEAILSVGLRTRNGKLPAHVDYHGGGFVIGNLQTNESWCRQACNAVGCVIVNVDYRLSPEFPHPTPALDSFEALKWVFASVEELGIDHTRISVGGISAGANLAAVVALMTREEANLPKLVLQLLTVPLVDVRFVSIEGTEIDKDKIPYRSLVELEYAPSLPLQRLQWFYDLWLGTDAEHRKQVSDDYLASPILVANHGGLPPASIHVAGADPLISEGKAYHEKLLKDGTPSQLKVYDGVAHPFPSWDGVLDKAREYVQDTFVVLRNAYTT